VATQDRPQEDVAETSFGQVHDLGEHRVLIECFLGAEMLLHELPEAFVRVTEPTEEPRPRWADEASQRDAEPAAVQRLFGGRGDRGHSREPPRQRRRLPDRHRLDVSRLEHDLLVAAAQSLAELAKEQRLTRTRRRGLIREQRERQVVQERRRLGGRFEADARFLVERLDQRDFPPLVPRREGFAKLVEAPMRAGSRQPSEQIGAGHDLGDHGRSQRRRGRRLRHVDLEEARQLDLGGQRLERARNGAVSFGRDTQSRGVDRLELLPGGGERPGERDRFRPRE
jgi:hypothetical protein